MTPSRPSSNEPKLRELVLLLANMSEKDEPFASVKLNKLLFRIDFEAFVRWGKPVTGAPYFALQQGPAPRPMKRILEMMKNAGDIDIRQQMYQGGKQERVVGLREARTSNFRPDELALASEMVKTYWGKSGNAMSAESHEFLGWKVANLEEDIPYTVALIGKREPTAKEIEYGKTLIQRAEECLARNSG